jgi:hypothetical protein
MEISEVSNEIKKVIRAAYNVESTRMEPAETLSINISIPGSIKESGDYIEDLCYNEAFMHGLVMVEDPYITELRDERIYTTIKLIMVKMSEIPLYIRKNG